MGMVSRIVKTIFKADVDNFNKGIKAMAKESKVLNKVLETGNKLIGRNADGTKKATKEVQNHTNAVKKESLAMKASNKAMGVMDSMLDGLKSAYGLTTLAVVGAMNAVGALTDYIGNQVKMASELDTATQKTGHSFNMSEKEAKAYSKELSGLSAETGKTTMELLEGAKQLAEQGYSSKETISILTESAKLSTMANIEMAESNLYVSRTLKAFNMDASRANEVVAMGNKLNKEYGADMDEIADIVGEVGSEWVRAGGSLDGMNALIAKGLSEGKDYERITMDIEKAVESGTMVLDNNTTALAENFSEMKKINEIDLDSLSVEKMKQITSELRNQRGIWASIAGIQKDIAEYQMKGEIRRKETANIANIGEALMASGDRRYDPAKAKQLYEKYGYDMAVAVATGISKGKSEFEAYETARLSGFKATPYKKFSYDNGLGSDSSTGSDTSALDAYNLEKLRKQVAYEKYKIGLGKIANDVEQKEDLQHQLEMAKMDMDFYGSQKDMDAEALKAQASYLKAKQKLNNLEVKQETDKFDMMGLLGDAGVGTARDVTREIVKDGEVSLKELGALALENVAMAGVESGTKSLLAGMAQSSAFLYGSAKRSYKNAGKAFAIAGVAGVGAGALNNSIEEDKEDFDSYEEQVDQIEEEVIQEESQECSTFIVQGMEPFLDALREHSRNKYNYDLIATEIGKKRRL